MRFIFASTLSEKGAMSSVIQQVCNLPAFFRGTAKYRRRYGFLTGLRVATKVRRAERVAASGTLVSVPVPGLQCTVLLRARTADVDVFTQFFETDPFDLELGSEPSFIVDAGAHIGLCSLYLIHRFPSACIAALEPELGNYALLQANTRTFASIVPINAGLWSNECSLRIADSSVGTSSFSVSETVHTDPNYVPGYGVADLMRLLGRDEIDFLKIDIEGAEKQVFSSGFTSWIDRVRVIAIELHDRLVPGCRQIVEDAILGGGFTKTQCGEYAVFFRRDSGVKHRATGHFGSGV